MSVAGLQCPGCGHIHALEALGRAETFRCGGCRRLLSVPAHVLAGHGPAPRPAPGLAPRPGPSPEPDAGHTNGPVAPGPRSGGVVSEMRRPAPPRTEPGVRPRRRLPTPVRVLVWLVSLSVGFLVAAAVLRAVGILEVDHVIDAYAGSGLRRFGVLVLLIPFWAALAATTAHLALEWGDRRLRRRSATRQSPSSKGRDASAAHSDSDPS